MADHDYEQPTIEHLPNELISQILSEKVLSCKDVLNLGSTCKKYDTLTKFDQSIWKHKLETILSSELFKVVHSNSNGDWLLETKNYYNLRRNLMLNLSQMSVKFYRYEREITAPELINYFELAFTNNINFFLTVSILSEYIKKAKKYLEKINQDIIKKYTLTDIHYAKIVLRHMMHMYLMLKWTQMFRDLHVVPEAIVNFFIQWIDTVNIHLDEDVDIKINELVTIAENLLGKSHVLKTTPIPEREMWNKYLIPNSMWSLSQSKEILSAVTAAVYTHKRMTIVNGADIDTLDIVKVIDTKFGNVTAVAAIYAAVARQCGVRCDLIAFPNHLFLEWNEQNVSPAMIVNLPNGKLERKRQCPFSQANNMKADYNPHALLRHLIKIYNQCMGSIRHGGQENVEHIFNFIEHTYNIEENPYRNYYQYLKDVMEHSMYRVPLHIKSLDIVFRKLIITLAKLNESKKMPKLRNSIVKKHDRSVKYAIGMMCYHIRYQYICIICGWDTTCAASEEWQSHMSVHTLEFGAEQPFYNVIAADYSERYVAQENLLLRNPHRIYHLEDELAREFSHFDGFAYIPNNEKAAEYPEDEDIREWYRTKSS